MPRRWKSFGIVVPSDISVREGRDLKNSDNVKRLLQGPEARISIYRDEYGIPHIRAKNSWDCFWALGYAHAQDRMWHMDFQRRKALGRSAEWLGPDGLEADKLARRLNSAAAAQRDYAALGSTAKDMLNAYARGVNSYIDLGIKEKEYELLGESPERWESWHSIAVMRQIGLLMGSFWMKLFRAAMLPYVGAENVTKLRYDDGGIDLLCIPGSIESERLISTLDELRPSIEALLATQSPDLTGGGSNNWAISGHLTSTGRPILMGDPHRELELPTMYSQAHIACDDYDVIGLTVPGVPGFPHVAHNGNVAWCVTHAFVDIHDLYVEKFRSEGKEVLFKDEWHEVRSRLETIKVRGKADESIECLETSHGPVILGNPADGSAITLRSVQFFETDNSFDCLPEMMRVASVEQLYKAVHPWGLIDHNLVAADTHGTIGHRVRAKVPQRSSVNGWLPVPGWTGGFEWQGMVAPFDMPESINPSAGSIVTANNRVVDDRNGLYLCTDCHPPHRARRIRELLASKKQLSISSMSDIYMDVATKPGLLFQEMANRQPTVVGPAKAMLEDLRAWNGEMTVNAPAAVAYSKLRLSVTKVVAEILEIGNRESKLMHSNALLDHLWWIVPSLLRSADESLLKGKSWDDVFRIAIDRVGNEMDEGNWAEQHAPVLHHSLSKVFPDESAALDMRCALVGGDNDTVFATGYSASQGFQTKYSALARTSFDVGNWENCEWVVFQGASGRIGDVNRTNQNGLWAEGKTVRMRYDWSLIAQRCAVEHIDPA